MTLSSRAKRGLVGVAAAASLVLVTAAQADTNY